MMISLSVTPSASDFLGYKESARIAKKSLADGVTVREIIIKEGLMTEEQVNEVLHVDNLTKLNIQ